MADAPPPPAEVEKSLFWGQLLMMSFYGVEVFIYAFSTHLILCLPPSTRKGRLFYVYLGAVILVLVTVVVFTDAVFLQLMWINHRNDPGGPLGFLAENSSVWWQTLGTGCNELTNLIGDGLLLYRCFVIYNNNFWVVLFPILLYLGSASMGIMLLVQSAVPDSNFFHGKTVSFGTPWAALSVTLNVLLTCLITYRILGARKNARRFLNHEGRSLDVYTSLASILVESSLPFSILGLAFAITYGKNLDEGPAFLFVWAVFSALSPQFIIFRVASGRAWTRDIASQVTRTSTLVFGGVKTVESHQLQSTIIFRNNDDNDELGTRSVGSTSKNKVVPV